MRMILVMRHSIHLVMMSRAHSRSPLATGPRRLTPVQVGGGFNHSMNDMELRGYLWPTQENHFSHHNGKMFKVHGWEPTSKQAGRQPAHHINCATNWYDSLNHAGKRP